MSLAILFHFLCVQHVSDINISNHQELATILLNYHIGHTVLGSTNVVIQQMMIGYINIY